MSSTADIRPTATTSFRKRTADVRPRDEQSRGTGNIDNKEEAASKTSRVDRAPVIQDNFTAYLPDPTAAPARKRPGWRTRSRQPFPPQELERLSQGKLSARQADVRWPESTARSGIGLVCPLSIRLPGNKRVSRKETSDDRKGQEEHRTR